MAKRTKPVVLTSEERKRMVLDARTLIKRIDPGKNHWPLILSMGSMMDVELKDFRDLLTTVDAKLDESVSRMDGLT